MSDVDKLRELAMTIYRCQLPTVESEESRDVLCKVRILLNDAVRLLDDEIVFRGKAPAIARECGQCAHQSNRQDHTRCRKCDGVLYQRIWLCQWCHKHVRKIAGQCNKCGKSLVGSMEF